MNKKICLAVIVIFNHADQVLFEMFSFIQDGKHVILADK